MSGGWAESCIMKVNHHHGSWNIDYHHYRTIGKSAITRVLLYFTWEIHLLYDIRIGFPSGCKCLLHSLILLWFHFIWIHSKESYTIFHRARFLLRLPLHYVFHCRFVYTDMVSTGTSEMKSIDH